MEKATRITSKELAHGWHMHLECCMCGTEETFVGGTQKEVLEILKEAGWKNLNSDDWMIQGHWCGCKYNK